jgi:hypothetical protein
MKYLLLKGNGIIQYAKGFGNIPEDIFHTMKKNDLKTLKFKLIKSVTLKAENGYVSDSATSGEFYHVDGYATFFETSESKKENSYFLEFCYDSENFPFPNEEIEQNIMDICDSDFHSSEYILFCAEEN